MTSFIENEKINENPDDLKEFSRLIVAVSKNHHHCHDFFNKFDHILQFISADIKNRFSEQDIFHLFRKNLRLLLYLFENSIIIMTEQMAKYLTRNCNVQYRKYFFNEVRQYINSQKCQKI